MENTVRRKHDSAYVTQEIEICVCDDCKRKGATELYYVLTDKINKLGMSSFISVKTIRLKENHPEGGIYISLNGKRIEKQELDLVLKAKVTE